MAVMDSGSGGMGAYCALHPVLGASGTCERCGNFMCDLCGERGAQTFCPGCRERAGHPVFPLRRDTWNFSALWDYCFAAFKRDWLMLSVAMLVAMAMSVGANLVSKPLELLVGDGAPLLSIVVSVVLAVFVQMAQGVIGMGMMRVVFDVLDGGNADVARLFSQFHKAGRYVGATLLGGVAVFLPLLLLFSVLSFVGLVAMGYSVESIVTGDVFRSTDVDVPAALGVFVGVGVLTLVPGLYFGLPLYLIQEELTFNEDVSAVEALRNCYALARGERLSVLGVALVGALLGLAGMLACCVGLIPTLALSQLLLGGLYLALRKGSELKARPR
ncbi:hypothetical protein [Archangium lipolyticum]|uniref:hypothetical protein n=1 Tax=Archangium lipolyticum TaxID=2970465 RepID=UPI002149BC13|nr:hypothetical protein [Archangium lipolyticum]